MPIPLIPWEPSNIPEEIQDELNRRRSNRNFKFVKSNKGEWDEADGEWKKYKGPMTPWVRLCSNGAGRSNPYEGSDEYFDKQGFVFFGGKNFYSSYGFLNNADLGYGTSNPGIIGYMPDGRPHVIDNDIRTSDYPIHVPPPEIEKISVNIQKELYRRATIDWVCFSSKQLEYMTPYFLVPGISCVLEWGWNHFDPTSLLNLNDTNLLKELKKNPYPLYTDHILKSRGNYDVLFGVITHFEWSIDGTRIRCKTEITSPDRIYAGLVVNSSTVIQDLATDTTEILKSLRDFISKELPQIKSVVQSKDVSKITGGIGKFIQYLQKTYREKDEWKEILYGVFYGRDLTESKVQNPGYQGGWGGPTYTTVKTNEKVAHDKLKYKNKDDDFDAKDQSQIWINMRLLFEVLNFHSKDLPSYTNDPMFKVDISDCVISGHPNLISTNGSIMLIPNAEAPKYFYGAWGSAAMSNIPWIDKEVLYDALTYWSPSNVLNKDNWVQETGSYTTYGFAPSQTKKTVQWKYKPQIPNDPFITPEDAAYKQMGLADTLVDISQILKVKQEDAEKSGLLPDKKVYKVCCQYGSNPASARRDDLDILINATRYSKCGKSKVFAFPFIVDTPPPFSGQTDRMYPRRYAGRLGDLYFNVAKLQQIVEDSAIKTFKELIDAVLKELNSASGNMWDLRLVDSTGRYGLNKDDYVTMKIVDYKFNGAINRGKVYTFDYYDAESLLQSIKFTPTISNPQAIRTMYAETNNPKNRVVLSDQNELLDYNFKDRLRLDVVQKPPEENTRADSFKETITSLQLLKPAEGSMQMTYADNQGLVHVKRLVLPSPEILKLLLEDGDKENNPRYTGIMPNIQAQFTIQGIGGLRTFMMFLVRNLPEPYSHKNIVFRIIDLSENIEAGKWTTTITAGILPLRKFIRDRLGITTETGK